VFLPSALATRVSPALDDASIDRWFNTESMRVVPAFTAQRISFMWNDLRVPNINPRDIQLGLKLIF
jgi:hypothetical protein